MHNIKLIIAYDGTNYLGWQKTHMGPSIEENLQKVLEQILQRPVHLQAASRTDAGVHAQGQVVNFLTTKAIHFSQFSISLNSLLPKDISVREVCEAPSSFHPTLDCMGKEYGYFACLGPYQLPHHRFYSWHVYAPLNLEVMRQALPHFIGRHDFASFCNVKKNAKYTDYIREVHALELLELDEQRLCFRICGNHFLYKMVRNIVGTLVDIGKGKLSLKDLPTIFQTGSRPTAGVTAPAHGLFLNRVIYPDNHEFVSLSCPAPFTNRGNLLRR